MIKFEPLPIKFDARQVGLAFAEAACDDQAMFLYGLIDAIPFGKWAMQCSYIAAEIKVNEDAFIDNPKQKVIDYLECLIEHLKD